MPYFKHNMSLSHNDFMQTEFAKNGDHVLAWPNRTPVLETFENLWSELN